MFSNAFAAGRAGAACGAAPFSDGASAAGSVLANY
jgi:hypothetical protein